MALFETFERWQAADFLAWQPPKRASNRFTPERSRIRERAKSLFEQALAQSGIQRGATEVWASKPEPSFFNDHSVDHVAVVLTRAQADRERVENQHPALAAARPETYSAHAGVVVDSDGVLVVLRVPATATMDLAAAAAAVELWRGWAELFGWQVTADEGVALTRRWSTDEALSWAEPIADIAMWMTQALPALQGVIGQVVLPVAAAEDPSPARVSAPLPPATVQAGARAWQPYRPQMPPPPRKLPVETRPSLLERLDPFRLQPEPEPQAPQPRQWSDRPQRSQTATSNQHTANSKQQTANSKQHAANSQQPAASSKQQAASSTQPREPGMPVPGAKCVLVGGLLAGKDGLVVATGRTIRVRVGALEFELQPHQVRAV